MTPVRWLLMRAAEVPEGSFWLDPDESEHAARLRLPTRHADYRLGRWTAKRAVALWLGRDPDPAGLCRIAIRPAPDGAPAVFLDNAPAPLAISFSHRAGHAACAVAPAGTALGCDLELIEPRSPAFVQDYFTDTERKLVEAADEAGRPLLANLIWSAKESALKALREGLRMDPREVEVSLGPKEENGWRPLTVHRVLTGQVFHGWWRREGDFVLTVAAAPPPGPPLPAGDGGLARYLEVGTLSPAGR